MIKILSLILFFSAPLFADGFLIDGRPLEDDEVIVWYMGDHQGFTAIWGSTDTSSFFPIAVSTTNPAYHSYFVMKYSEFPTEEDKIRDAKIWSGTTTPGASYWTLINNPFDVPIDKVRPNPASLAVE